MANVLDNDTSLERRREQGRRVLVVDAQDAFRRKAGRVLLELGHHAILASDTSTALAHMQQHIPDLLLLDLNLIDNAAAKMFREVRNSPRLGHLPIAFYNRGDQPSEIIPGIQLLESVLIQKPFTASQLRKRLRGVMARLEVIERCGVVERFTGELEALDLCDVLGLLAAFQRSGRLTVASPGDDQLAVIHFVAGQLASAQVGEINGQDVLMELLLWSGGSFRFIAMSPDEAEEAEQLEDSKLRLEDRPGALEYLHLVDRGRLNPFPLLAERVQEAREAGGAGGAAVGERRHRDISVVELLHQVQELTTGTGDGRRDADESVIELLPGLAHVPKKTNPDISVVDLLDRAEADAEAARSIRKSNPDESVIELLDPASAPVGSTGDVRKTDPDISVIQILEPEEAVGVVLKKTNPDISVAEELWASIGRVVEPSFSHEEEPSTLNPVASEGSTLASLVDSRPPVETSSQAPGSNGEGAAAGDPWAAAREDAVDGSVSDNREVERTEQNELRGDWETRSEDAGEPTGAWSISEDLEVSAEREITGRWNLPPEQGEDGREVSGGWDLAAIGREIEGDSRDWDDSAERERVEHASQPSGQVPGRELDGDGWTANSEDTTERVTIFREGDATGDLIILAEEDRAEGEDRRMTEGEALPAGETPEVGSVSSWSDLRNDPMFQLPPLFGPEVAELMAGADRRPEDGSGDASVDPLTRLLRQTAHDLDAQIVVCGLRGKIVASSTNDPVESRALAAAAELMLETSPGLSLEGAQGGIGHMLGEVNGGRAVLLPVDHRRVLLCRVASSLEVQSVVDECQLLIGRLTGRNPS